MQRSLSLTLFLIIVNTCSCFLSSTSLNRHSISSRPIFVFKSHILNKCLGVDTAWNDPMSILRMSEHNCPKAKPHDPSDTYESRKVALISKMAQIYWERVVCYTLAGDKTGITWHDLVHMRPTLYMDYKEDKCNDILEEFHPDLLHVVVNPVHHFIRQYKVPLFVPVSDSNDDAIALIDEVKSFKLKDHDEHENMVRVLLRIIEKYLASNILPTSKEARRKISSFNP